METVTLIRAIDWDTVLCQKIIPIPTEVFDILLQTLPMKIKISVRFSTCSKMKGKSLSKLKKSMSMISTIKEK